MPWTLVRSMIADLCLVVLLTTLVLVTVIAFGATIKPLANDSILSAGQAFKYVILATVPMMQFALPFAAGFASTISLHRMTSDNEIVAAAASGISYRRLLAPVVLLGIVLVLAMVVLTQVVIPQFWGLLAQAVSRDFVRHFEASIARGEPFEIGSNQIFADRLIVDAHPPSGADTRLVLLRVAAASLDDEGRISTDVTAAQAVVDVYRRDGLTYLKMSMEDTVVYRPETGVLTYVRSTEPPTTVLPSVLADEPKHLTRNEMLELRANPDRYWRVIEARTELADSIRAAELWRDIQAELERVGAVLLRATGESERTFEVRATGLEKRRLVSSNGPLEIIERIGGEARRIILPGRASVTRRIDAATRTLAVDLDLRDCRVQDALDPTIENRRAEIPLLNLVVDQHEADDLAELPSAELLTRAEGLGDYRTDDVDARMDRVHREIEHLGRETRSRLTERYAVATTAGLVMVLGAVLAMWRRESAPLTVYLWAFLPSVLDLIVISSGENIMRDGPVLIGGLFMWSGHLALIGIIVFAYTRLARN